MKLGGFLPEYGMSFKGHCPSASLYTNDFKKGGVSSLQKTESFLCKASHFSKSPELKDLTAPSQNPRENQGSVIPLTR
jgi:hypothetical protein